MKISQFCPSGCLSRQMAETCQNGPKPAEKPIFQPLQPRRRRWAWSVKKIHEIDHIGNQKSDVCEKMQKSARGPFSTVKGPQTEKSCKFCLSCSL